MESIVVSKMSVMEKIINSKILNRMHIKFKQLYLLKYYHQHIYRNYIDYSNIMNSFNDLRTILGLNYGEYTVTDKYNNTYYISLKSNTICILNTNKDTGYTLNILLYEKDRFDYDYYYNHNIFSGTFNLKRIKDPLPYYEDQIIQILSILFDLIFKDFFKQIRA